LINVCLLYVYKKKNDIVNNICLDECMFVIRVYKKKK